MSHIVKVYATREGYEPPSIIVTVPRKQSSVSSITIVLVVQQNNQVQTTYTNSWSEQTIFGGTFDMVSGEALLLQYDGSYIQKQGTPNQIALTLGWNFISSAQGDVEVTQPRSVTGNSFSLDGVSSDLYGVGLSGTGVWDAPARKGESISVPGRNGNIWVDDGSFENILVTYPCWMSEDFAENVGDFRSFLSRHSDQYYRITDTYHPDEFRLGRYAGAFTATPGTCNKTGRFDVVFDCMPQRFTNAGNTWRELTIPNINPAQNVANLLTEVNPTGFKSAPVIMMVATANGYLEISIRNDGQNRYNYVRIDDAVANTYYYIDCEDFSLREGTSPNWDGWELYPISTTATLSIIPQSGSYTDYTALLYEGENVINNRTMPNGGQTYTNMARFSILTRYWTV